MVRKIGRASLVMGIGPAVFALLWLGLRFATAQTPAAALSSLTRSEDPVVVPGANMPALLGSPVGELVAYTYQAGAWGPIPYQIDERTNDITGTYVISDDGLLDDNDELVFMAKDAGEQAPFEAWPADVEARGNPRIQVRVNDPLNPGEAGWAYLYRSTTLTPSPTSYVAWDEGLQTATALSYTAAFSPQAFVGLADLSINGNGVDVLDRQKTRIEAFLLSLDEEDLAGLVTAPISIPVVGPVRGVAGGGLFNVSIYGARLEFLVSLDLPFDIDELRTSLDLNDPAQTGVTSYFDSNGTAVPIDGVPETVPASPRLDWYQASGSAGGLVVAIPLVNTAGAQANYYKDDSTIDTDDTGDQRSYGDAGLKLSNVPSDDVIDINLVAYILPPGTLTNVGAGYFDRVNNPLTATTGGQYYGQSIIYLPAVLKP